MTSAVLDPTRHARIIADMTHVCEIAGLQPKFLRESMKEHCGAEELAWVRDFPKNRQEGVAGLLLVGIENPNSRCQAICGALIRNYTDARVLPLNTVLAMADKGGDIVSPSCLIIPNLYVANSLTSLPGWKIQALYDALLSRTVKSKPTVAYIEDMAAVVHSYGKPFADFLGSFKVVQK